VTHIRVTFDKSKGYRKWSKLAGNYRSDFQKLKKRIGVRGITNIQNEIEKRRFRHPGTSTGELENKLSYELVERGIKFTSGAEYSSYLNKGIRRHVMTYLRKAKGPIPMLEHVKHLGFGVNVYGDKTIYRNVGRKDWVRPADNRFKNFFGKALKKTIQESIVEVKKMLRS
jgi:hypothetical protein